MNKILRRIKMCWCFGCYPPRNPSHRIILKPSTLYSYSPTPGKGTSQLPSTIFHMGRLQKCDLKKNMWYEFLPSDRTLTYQGHTKELALELKLGNVLWKKKMFIQIWHILFIAVIRTSFLSLYYSISELYGSARKGKIACMFIISRCFIWLYSVYGITHLTFTKTTRGLADSPRRCTYIYLDLAYYREGKAPFFHLITHVR